MIRQKIKIISILNQFQVKHNIQVQYIIIYYHNKMSWLNDQNIKKVKEIKTNFMNALNQVSKELNINYYDFLLVAKKLGFRFEQANHLMALKNYFIKMKNILDKRKLVDLLLIHNNYISNQSQDKLVVKFNLHDNNFDAIQEATNEDEEYNQTSEKNIKTQEKIWKDQYKVSKSSVGQKQQKDYQEKIDIIVSIKMQEMAKKISLIKTTVDDDNELIQKFQMSKKEKITFVDFKNGILKIFRQSKEKLKISEDDIKTIFYLLDSQKQGCIDSQKLHKLRYPFQFLHELSLFYRLRVNPNLIKNTQFKRSKLKNNVQVFQVKNASVLELEILDQTNNNEQLKMNEFKQELKKKILKSKPSFGPLKPRYQIKRNNEEDGLQMQNTNIENSTNNLQIWLQRQRIQKILKLSKQKKKEHNNSKETIANKLRSLFIHKVILPRERMIEEQKQMGNKKYGKIKPLGNQILAIKPTDKR